jgi:hypothetical protein
MRDDCVIGAGGIGVRNARLGGATHIAYLAPDEAPGMAEIRAREAVEAWRLAGVDSQALIHWTCCQSFTNATRGSSTRPPWRCAA